MCALFAHECNSFQNSYFVQLLHFKEIKFRTFSQQMGKRIRLSRYKSRKISFCKYTVYLLCCCAQINPQRIKDTPAVNLYSRLVPTPSISKGLRKVYPSVPIFLRVTRTLYFLVQCSCQVFLTKNLLLISTPAIRGGYENRPDAFTLSSAAVSVDAV